MEIVPFADEHLDGAARCSASDTRATARPSRCCPRSSTSAAQIEREWRAEGASGVAALGGGELVGYLVGPRREDPVGPHVWRRDRRPRVAASPSSCATSTRPLRRAGSTKGRRATSSSFRRRRELVDPWFRLSLRRLGRARHARDRGRASRGGQTWPSARARETISRRRLDSTARCASRCCPRRASRTSCPRHEELVDEWRATLGREGHVPALRRRTRRAHRRPHSALPAASRPSRPRGLDRPRRGVDRARRARNGSRARAHRARPRLGPRAGLPDDDHGLADDEPARLALLAAARLPRDLPPALPLDPVDGDPISGRADARVGHRAREIRLLRSRAVASPRASGPTSTITADGPDRYGLPVAAARSTTSVPRIPLLSGSSLVVVNAPDDAVVLTPPAPERSISDVGAASATPCASRSRAPRSRGSCRAAGG